MLGPSKTIWLIHDSLAFGMCGNDLSIQFFVALLPTSQCWLLLRPAEQMDKRLESNSACLCELLNFTYESSEFTLNILILFPAMCVHARALISVELHRGPTHSIVDLILFIMMYILVVLL